MFNKITLFTLFALFAITTTFAQVEDEEAKKRREANEAAVKKGADKEGWSVGAGLGLDFSNLLLVNPRVGAGQNRIGLGSVVTAFAKYQKGKFIWDNNLSQNFSVQRLGKRDNNVFTKNVDDLRLSSLATYKFSEKWGTSLNAAFRSQLTPTYAGNIIKQQNNEPILAKIFSPAYLDYGLGITYLPNSKWSLYYSPVHSKVIIVANDEIAALNVHGNDSKNLNYQFGSSLKATYTNKFLKDRIAFTSSLGLFSNYLDHPEWIDVDWSTETAFTIWKGIAVSFGTLLQYDREILVQKTNDDGVIELKNGVSYNQQLLIKYNHVF